MALVTDVVFLLALLFAFALQQPEFLVGGSALCAIYVLLKLDSRVKLGRLLAVLMVGVLLLPATFRLYHGFSPLFYLFSAFLAFYAAERFSRSEISHVCSVLSVVFWMCFVCIMVGALIYWDEAEPLENIIPGTSTNGIPSYLIVLQVTLSVCTYVQKNRLPILAPVATFVVALIGLGRGSIIVAALILLLSIAVNQLFLRNIYWKLSLIGGAVFILVLVIFSDISGWSDSINQLIEGSKFSAGVLDEHRGRMVKDYIDQLSGSSLLLGADYSGTSIATLYGGNPHNSFIRLHSMYGIAGLLVVFASLLSVLISSRQLFKKTVVFIFLALLFLRAVTEPILFPTLLDFFYFVCLFIFFRHAPNSRMSAVVA